MCGSSCESCLRFLCLCDWQHRVARVQDSLFRRNDTYDKKTVAWIWTCRLALTTLVFQMIAARWNFTTVVVAILLLLNGAPLHPSHLAWEVVCVTLLVRCLPFASRVIACVGFGAIAGALWGVLVSRENRMLQGVMMGVVCFGCELCRAFHDKNFEGTGFLATVNVSLGVTMIIIASDYDLLGLGSLRFARSVAVSKLLRFLGVELGLVFAQTLTSNSRDDEETKKMDEEFASIPQHTGSLFLTFALFVLQFWANVPVFWMIAACVDAEIILRLLGVCEGLQLLSLRVSFQLPPVILQVCEAVKRVAVSVFPDSSDTLISIVSFFIVKGVVCFALLPFIAHLSQVLVVAGTLWAIFAVLSQGHFAIAFVAISIFVAVVAHALLCAISGSFGDHPWLWCNAAVSISMSCVSILWSNRNKKLFWRAEHHNNKTREPMRRGDVIRAALSRQHSGPEQRRRRR